VGGFSERWFVARIDPIATGTPGRG
jgi:hypothetical protein